MGGNVEVLHFEGEFVVVVYHVSLPESYPVTLPVGFVSAEADVVKSIGQRLASYLDGNSSFDRPNDCGPIERLAGISQ